MQQLAGIALMFFFCLQVAPSFFDAPGAQAAGKVTPHQKINPLGAHLGLGGSPVTTQRFSQDLPDVTFAFASESGCKVSPDVILH